MAVTKVNPGEVIKASKINEIIDAVGSGGGTPAPSPSLPNGTVCIDSGLFCVVYNNKIYAFVSMGNVSSSTKTYNIGGHTWTVPTANDFSTVVKAVSTNGMPIGHIMAQFACNSWVRCVGNKYVYLDDGSIDNDSGHDCQVVAYRSLS